MIKELVRVAVIPNESMLGSSPIIKLTLELNFKPYE